MSKSLEVTYDVAEVEGLVAAKKILAQAHRELETACLFPAWQKICHAEKYIADLIQERLKS